MSTSTQDSEKRLIERRLIFRDHLEDDLTRFSKADYFVITYFSNGVTELTPYHDNPLKFFVERMTLE